MVTANDLIKAIRSDNDAGKNPLLLSELNNNTDEILCRVWFKNYRAGKGLRLTNQGLIAFKSLYTSYSFNLGDGYKVKSHHLIFLDRVCKMPWHLDAGHLTLFDKDFAFRFKLIGDLDTFINAYKDLSTKFSSPLRSSKNNSTF